VSEKFAFIDAEKAMFSIVKMCGWLGVSTSGFYDWLNRSASATAQRRTHVVTCSAATAPRTRTCQSATARTWPGIPNG
jgi:hypothetical protein